MIAVRYRRSAVEVRRYRGNLGTAFGKPGPDHTPAVYSP